MKVTQAYRFALDPSPAQERALRSHAGAARFAWNWGLARCTGRYEAEGKWYSGAELHKLWNAEKKADPSLAWWAENSKCAYQEAFRNLDRALRDFVKSKKGQRKGRRLGFPRFKKRGKARDSFRFAAGVMRCAGTTVTLPRLGTVRTREDTGKLASRLEGGTARILSATVSRTAQRWFVSFTVEVERDVPERHSRPGSAAGIDLGVKALLTGVDDRGRVIEVEGPKPLRAALRRLRRASRAHSRKERGSARRRKASARLARAVSDQGFGAARRMLGYKTAWNGGTLLVADRWYPSSKTCSNCGSVKATLTLKNRVFACDHCGHTEDRDVNAARNLLSLAASGAESINARGAAVSPGVAGHAVLKREPGTRVERGKTGTAPQQCEAAA